MRYLITFSYDGSKYNGYQRQPNKVTIQGELEKALTKINNAKKVEVSASGRTDAKVHALNQKAHFDLSVDITCRSLKQALNGLIPDDIYIRDAALVSDDFHARYNVTKKEYIYKLNMGEYNPIDKNYTYQHNKQLDITSMQAAIKLLEGKHNFKSFTKVDSEKDGYEREIIKANIDVYNDIVTFTFLGTGFLRHMVRNMVGTLIMIGEGKKKSSDISEILSSKDRKKAGYTAKPEGLCLKEVFY